MRSATSLHTGCVSSFLASLILLSVPTISLAETYSFPFKRDDFNYLERVHTNHHESTDDIQKEGFDISIVRYLDDKNWTFLKDGKDGSKNKHSVVYGRNVYAIADGRIIGCWRNAPENPRPANDTDDLKNDKGSDRKWLHPEFNNNRIPGGGNMLFVEHADGTIALYAHFKPGSIPEALCPINDALFPAPNTNGDKYVKDEYKKLPAAQQARVSRGQKVGEVGNTGNSSGPHFHLHVENGSVGSKMIFEQGWAKNFISGATDIEGGWKSFAGKEIPRGAEPAGLALVLAPRETNYRMSDLEVYQSGNKLVYAGIMKPGRDSPAALFKNNWNSFLQAWQDLERKGFRMQDFEVYKKGNHLRYAGIFEPGNYKPAALFKTDWNSFLSGWQQLEKDGYRMHDLEIYKNGSRLTYAGIFKPGNYKPAALFKDNWADFQRGWQDLERKGYRMMDLEIYKNGNKLNYAGIFEPGNYNPAALFKNNWKDFLNGWRDLESKGYRMKDLEVYSKGSGLSYAGIFEPGEYGPVAIFDKNWKEFVSRWRHFE